MGNTIVREATEADVDELLTVYHSAYRENRELGFPMKAENATAADVKSWMAEERLLVAEIDGTVVGAVRIERTDETSLKLSRLGVHDDWKGHGIGSRLLEQVESFASESANGRIWLTTPPDHPYLPELYRKRGYVETGVSPLDYRDYDEIVMEKELESTDG